MSPLGSGREEEEEEETPGPRQTQLGGEVLVQITSQKIAAQSLGRDQSSTRSTVIAKEKTAREKRWGMRLAHPTAWFSRFINMPCHQSFAFFGSYLPSLLSGEKKRRKKEPSSPCVYL
jgi:hypothetical protein